MSLTHKVCPAPFLPARGKGTSRKRVQTRIGRKRRRNGGKKDEDRQESVSLRASISAVRSVNPGMGAGSCKMHAKVRCW